MIKRNRIPTILGIIVLLAGTFAGVFFLNMNQVFRIGASVGTEPKNVRVSNVSDNSATISWTTDVQTSDFLLWGDSQGSTNTIENETAGGDKYFTHSISISGLKANTSYFYKINSEGILYDNNGVPWQLTTGSPLGQNSVAMVISGSVINSSGQPTARAIVYTTVQGYTASTLTSATGNFVFQLGSIRTADFTKYAQIDPAQTLLDISVDDGPDGVSSAQIFPQSANPVPPIVLGKVYDLRNLQTSAGGQGPSADLNLPQNSDQQSKFNVDTSSGSDSKKPTSVILESLSEGETVTSTKPEFFGKGPGGETIAITVHSDQDVSGTVKIPTNGSWSWSVPSGLTPGAHSITITWKDTSGITRSLTRNFVVQASELPAFEATPSQTLAPLISPTATPNVTATPKATATPKPSATPIPTATGSTEPVPVTGSLTPTLLLSIMGIVVLAFSLYIWKESTNA